MVTCLFDDANLMNRGQLIGRDENLLVLLDGNEVSEIYRTEFTQYLHVIKIVNYSLT